MKRRKKLPIQVLTGSWDIPWMTLSIRTPPADLANILPHNIKIFNLCYIKEKGLEKWLKEAPGIQNRYFKGKMSIGKGPEI